jgi:hypothetical protein
MLTVVPKHLFSWDCELREGESLVARLEIPYWGEHGTLRAQGEAWQLGREDWFHGQYFLRQAGRTLATAEKPSVLVRSFDVRFDSARYVWQARFPLVRSFALVAGGTEVGSMVPDAPFTRRSAVDLPAELSLERKAFLVWLALLLWRRQRRSN